MNTGWRGVIHVGDCIEVMRTLEANSFDSIVTDPPYGLGFMGKAWDHGVPGSPFWAEALRVAKPTDLMRWLCRLVTPTGGLVLDPFCGSGSTGRGAIAEGFRFVGIELDPDYARIAEARTRVTQPGLALGP